MTNDKTDALHQINAGILDVLSGFETLKDRAEAEIMDTVRDLDQMHRDHAGRIAALLAAHGEPTDDGSVRGTVNKVATTLRDWVGSLDADALSFVRQGEEQLLAIYDAALEAWPTGVAPAGRAVAAEQAEEVRAKIAALPAS